jgi:hypothetical protein
VEVAVEEMEAAAEEAVVEAVVDHLEDVVDVAEECAMRALQMKLLVRSASLFCHEKACLLARSSAHAHWAEHPVAGWVIWVKEAMTLHLEYIKLVWIIIICLGICTLPGLKLAKKASTLGTNP